MIVVRKNIIWACLAIALVSCGRESVLEPPAGGHENGGEPAVTTVVAQTETQEGTRTALADDGEGGFEVIWSEGDKLEALDYQEERHYLTLTEGAGTRSGVFSCDDVIPDGECKFFYGTDGTSLTKIQQYMGEGVISNAPMYAAVSVTDGKVPEVKFRNLCGLLRLTLKGLDVVKMITIIADGDALSGRIYISEDGTISFPRNYYTEVSLDLGEGVELSPEGKSFFIALPPKSYRGISIKVTDIDGYECTKTLKSGKTLDIVRSQITPVNLTVAVDRPISWDSPVGSVDMLEGRECMVVDYGRNIGKVAIATKNVGANEDTQTGPFYTWFEAIQAQNRGDWGRGWYMPSESETMSTPIGYSVRDEGGICIMNVTESSVLKFPLGGYYSNDVKQWRLVGIQSTLWGTDPVYYEEFETLDLASFVVYNIVMCPGLSDPADKLNIRPFHKLPITKNTPVGMVGYLDGRDAMVVELDINGQRKKVAVAIRNEGATHINTYMKPSNIKYLDCFGSYLTYAQAQSKCGDGWYIPTIEEWQSLMADASVVEDKLAYEGNFSSKDRHRAIVVNVNGNSLILPAGGPEEGSNQRGWQSYYWSSTANGSNMECLWSKDSNISTWLSDKNTTKNTRLFHALP